MRRHRQKKLVSSFPKSEPDQIASLSHKRRVLGRLRENGHDECGGTGEGDGRVDLTSTTTLAGRRGGGRRGLCGVHGLGTFAGAAARRCGGASSRSGCRSGCCGGGSSSSSGDSRIGGGRSETSCVGGNAEEATLVDIAKGVLDVEVGLGCIRSDKPNERRLCNGGAELVDDSARSRGGKCLDCVRTSAAREGDLCVGALSYLLGGIDSEGGSRGGDGRCWGRCLGEGEGSGEDGECGGGESHGG